MNFNTALLFLLFVISLLDGKIMDAYHNETLQKVDAVCSISTPMMEEIFL